MTFYTVRDLRQTPKEIWGDLQEKGEVVITHNGKPAALMLDLSGEDFDLMLRAVRQAKAMIAFNRMRAKAAQAGFLPDDEIEAEIAAARAGE